MVNKIKIIFVDIDWTILDHHKHDFDYESISALNKAQENGCLLYLCTARPYESVRKTNLLNYMKPDGLICTNGATGFINDEVVFADNFPKEIVNKIIKVCKQHNFTLELSTEKQRFFTQERNEYADAFFATYDEKIPIIKENFDDVNVSAILLFSPRDKDEELLKELPKEINLFRFAECAADLNIYPSSKAKGIERILSILNIDKKYAMGIGDDYGDIPMFESVGLAVAMGNAVEEAKNKAHFISKKVGESGVKYALEYFKLI